MVVVKVGEFMENEKVYRMSFSKVYPLLVAKAQRKGRTRAEVDEVISWLTGYTKEELPSLIEKEISYGDFFRNAPHLNDNRSMYPHCCPFCFCTEIIKRKISPCVHGAKTVFVNYGDSIAKNWKNISLIEKEISYGDFFRNAPHLNDNRVLITGVVCGVRVEEIGEPLKTVFVNYGDSIAKNWKNIKKKIDKFPKIYNKLPNITKNDVSTHISSCLKHSSHYFLKIFSIALPFASSSTSLSR